jgi:hypothetical protein
MVEMATPMCGSGILSFHAARSMPILSRDLDQTPQQSSANDQQPREDAGASTVRLTSAGKYGAGAGRNAHSNPKHKHWKE